MIRSIIVAVAKIPSGKTTIVSGIVPVKRSAGWSVSIGAFVSINKILIIEELMEFYSTSSASDSVTLELELWLFALERQKA